MRWMSMLLAFVMALSATVARADDKSDAERWAVLIGINDYAYARGWPSLLQAGCVAQETSSQSPINKHPQSPLNVGLRFLRPAAPGLKQAGPPCQQRGKRAWALTKGPERARVRFETSKPGLAPSG